MRNSTIISVTIAGLFSFSALAGGWYAFSSINDMRETLVSGKQELQKEDERAQTLLDVKRQLKRLALEREELREFFFKEEDIVKLLEQLENLAKHADIEMIVTAAAPAESQGKTVFRAGMKIDGSWQDAMYFVSLLESLPLRLEVTRVNLSGGESSGRWTGEVSLDLLSFVPKKAS
jgi:predicted nuclease with TOPRIM domain